MYFYYEIIINCVTATPQIEMSIGTIFHLLALTVLFLSDTTIMVLV